MSKLPVNFFDNLEYASNPNETNMETSAATEVTAPSAMVVFDKGDLNSAAYFLIKSLRTPFAANAIISVFVQESVRNNFIAMVQEKLPLYTSAAITSHPGFKRALELAAEMKLKTISAPGAATSTSSATLVCDVTHEHFGASGASSGIVTLHTFRTAKEAIALIAKESTTVNFSNVGIWNENHSCAYEIIGALKSTNYFINCWDVAVATPLGQQHAAKSGVFVELEKAYHYETLPHNGVQKSIVFPVGTIFAN